MELKKGYKQTEIGVIPEGWEVMKLRETLLEKPRYGVGAAAIASNSNFPTYLRITDIEEDGTLRKNDLKSVDHKKSDDYFLKKNDLVFARTGASVGKSYLYSSRDGFLVYAGFLIKVSPNSSILNSVFLRAFVSTKTYWNWIKIMSMRSGQPGLNSVELGNMLVPVPSIKEQHAIAQVLSDTDALIQAMEEKLAKKRAIKQGAMQRLLKAKEGWLECKFQDVLEGFSSGMTPYRGNPEYYTGSIPWITSGELNYNVITDTIEKITEDAVSKTNLHILPKGTFLMAITGLEAAGTRGSCAITGIEATTNQSCMALFPKEGKITTKYLYYYYNFYGEELAFRYCQGSKQQSYTGKIAKLLPIHLPSTIEEQTRIATILSDMDAEIAQLEEQLAKYRRVKTGLMQELLTGRIRLV